MRSFDRLTLTAWALNLYDAVITFYATRVCDLVELNPLMRFLLSRSTTAFIVIKLLVMTLVCLILWRNSTSYPKKMWIALTIILFLFVMVCVWNTYLVAVVLSG